MLLLFVMWYAFMPETNEINVEIYFTQRSDASNLSEDMKTLETTKVSVNKTIEISEDDEMVSKNELDSLFY